MSFIKCIEVGKYIKFKVAQESFDMVYGGTVRLDKNRNKVIQVSSEAVKKLQKESDWFYVPLEEDVQVLEDELEVDNPKVVETLRRRLEKDLDEIKDYDDNEDKKESLLHYRNAVIGVHQSRLISFMVLSQLLEQVDAELEKLETE